MLYLLRKFDLPGTAVAILFPFSLLLLQYPDTIEAESLYFSGFFKFIQSPWLNKTLFLLFFYLLLFSLQFVNRSNHFYNRRDNFIFVIPVILFLGLISEIAFAPSIIGALIFLYILNKLVQSFNDDGLSLSYFDIGLAYGFGILIDKNFIFLFPLAFIGLVLFRHGQWREWVFPFLGLGAIIILASGINYFINRYNIFVFKGLSFSIDYSEPLYALNAKKGVFTALFLIITVIASISITREILGKKVLLRRYYVFLLWVFLVATASFVILGLSPDFLIYAIIPLSYLLAHYYSNCKLNFLNEACFDLTFLFAILMLV